MNPSSSGEFTPEDARVEVRGTTSLHVSSPTAEAPRKVAIAVDPSSESAYAVKWAVKHYLRPGDAVVLLYVRLRGSADPSAAAAAANGVGGSCTAADIAQPLIDAKVSYKIHMVKDHEMNKRLCMGVETREFNAVIMGSRGFVATKRGRNCRLGSVSDYCFNHCACPVVVVRCPDEKDINDACQAMVTVSETEQERITEEEHCDASNENNDTMEMRVDPGPRSGAVLTRQAQHRSEDVWNDVDYTNAVFNCREHISQISREWNIDDRVLHYVTMAGFYGIHRLGSTYTIDRALITALIDRWRPETHTFHLTVGEATITLQDVAVLLGLRVNGHAVTGTADLVWATLVEKLLGVAPPNDMINGSALKFKWLRQQFSNLPPDADEQTIQCYARAYILNLMGGMLFADLSGGEVQLIYLPLLTDLKSAGEYSWGSAALAYLYRQLCRAAHKNKKDIGGPLILLQLWAWERMPIGRPRCTLPLMGRVEGDGPPPFGQNVQQGKDSLACRWLRVSYTYSHVATSLGYYRDALDKQGEDQFTWEPYTEDVLSRLTDICRSDPHIWRSQAPLICFDIIEWHRPERAMRQFGLVQFRPNVCDYNIELHKIDRRGKQHYDWAQIHSTYIQQWNHRQDMIVNAPPFATYLQAYTDYMSWYRQITRLIISSPNRPPSMHYHQPTSSGLHILACCLSNLAERGKQSVQSGRQLEQVGDIHALTLSYKEFSEYVVTQCTDALRKVSFYQFYPKGSNDMGTSSSIPTIDFNSSTQARAGVASASIDLNYQSLFATNDEDDEVDRRARRGRGRPRVRRRQ